MGAVGGIEELLTEYRNAWIAEGNSTRALLSRLSHLRDFFRFAAAAGVERVTQVSTELIESYRCDLAERRSLRGRPYSADTQRTAVVVLRAFLRRLVRTGRLFVDPTRSLGLPAAPSRLPDVLSRREMGRLLAAPDLATAIGLRDRAMVACLYETGVRVSELVGLAVADVDAEARTILVRYGKGRKDRVVAMGEVLGRMLAEYVREARPAFLELVTPRRKLADPGALFLSLRGRGITANSVEYAMTRLGRKARIRKRVTPHVLRHTCATHLVESGADVRVVQELLGHRSLGTTERYTRMALAYLKRGHRRRHPREREGRGQ